MFADRAPKQRNVLGEGEHAALPMTKDSFPHSMLMLLRIAQGKFIPDGLKVAFNSLMAQALVT